MISLLPEQAHAWEVFSSAWRAALRWRLTMVGLLTGAFVGISLFLASFLQNTTMSTTIVNNVPLLYLLAGGAIALRMISTSLRPNVLQVYRMPFAGWVRLLRILTRFGTVLYLVSEILAGVLFVAALLTVAGVSARRFEPCGVVQGAFSGDSVASKACLSSVRLGLSKVSPTLLGLGNLEDADACEASEKWVQIVLQEGRRAASFSFVSGVDRACGWVSNAWTGALVGSLMAGLCGACVGSWLEDGKVPVTRSRRRLFGRLASVFPSLCLRSLGVGVAGAVLGGVWLMWLGDSGVGAAVSWIVEWADANALGPIRSLWMEGRWAMGDVVEVWGWVVLGGVATGTLYVWSAGLTSIVLTSPLPPFAMLAGVPSTALAPAAEKDGFVRTERSRDLARIAEPPSGPLLFDPLRLGLDRGQIDGASLRLAALGIAPPDSVLWSMLRWHPGRQMHPGGDLPPSLYDSPFWSPPSSSSFSGSGRSSFGGASSAATRKTPTSHSRSTSSSSSDDRHPVRSEVAAAALWRSRLQTVEAELYAGRLSAQGSSSVPLGASLGRAAGVREAAVAFDASARVRAEFLRDGSGHRAAALVWQASAIVDATALLACTGGVAAVAPAAAAHKTLHARRGGTRRCRPVFRELAPYDVVADQATWLLDQGRAEAAADADWTAAHLRYAAWRETRDSFRDSAQAIRLLIRKLCSRAPPQETTTRNRT